MRNPLVSVIVPVYNAGTYLRPALECILSQTYTHLEILVIDDGSTDDCIKEIATLSDPRLTVFRKPNSGRAATLNYALERISGEFFVIQDADDLCAPHRVEKLVGAMLDHPHVAAVFTGYDIILEDRRLAPRSRAKNMLECEDDIRQFRMPSHDPTAMFRVSLAKEFEFESSLPVAAAWDYILRLGERHPMLVLADCLYNYRIHPNSNSRRNSARRQSAIEQVLRRAEQRRGLDPGSLAPAWKAGGDEGFEHGLLSHLIESVLDLKRQKQYLNAVRVAATSIQLHPVNVSFYKPLLFLLSPIFIINFYRHLKASSYPLCLIRNRYAGENASAVI